MISLAIMPDPGETLLYSGDFKERNVEITQLIPKDLRQSSVRIVALGKPKNRGDLASGLPADTRILKIVADAALKRVKLYPTTLTMQKDGAVLGSYSVHILPPNAWDRVDPSPASKRK